MYAANERFDKKLPVSQNQFGSFLFFMINLIYVESLIYVFKEMIYIYIQWMHQKSTSNIATNRFRFKLATNICNLYCFIDKVVIPRHTTYPLP